MLVMGFEGLKFGSGPKELGGSVDLISHYRLWPHYDFFCKKSLPSSISETHYLQKVVGEREVRKGDGMELYQLFHDVTLLREKNQRIQPFRLDVLADVFHMRETAITGQSSQDRRTITAVTELESMSKGRHHKKQRDRDKHRSKDHKRHKHRSKDRDDNEVKDNNRNGPQINGHNPLKNQEKKRRHKGGDHPSCVFTGIK